MKQGDEKIRPTASYEIGLIIKIKLLKIQGQICQPLQLFETSSQSKDALIWNFRVTFEKNILIINEIRVCYKVGRRNFLNLDLKRKWSLRQGDEKIRPKASY